jgi:hypothetical protein
MELSCTIYLRSIRVYQGTCIAVDFMCGFQALPFLLRSAAAGTENTVRRSWIAAMETTRPIYLAYILHNGCMVQHMIIR